MLLLLFPAAQSCYPQRHGHLHLIHCFLLAQSHLLLIEELKHEERMSKFDRSTLPPLAVDRGLISGNTASEDSDISEAECRAQGSWGASKERYYLRHCGGGRGEYHSVSIRLY